MSKQGDLETALAPLLERLERIERQQATMVEVMGRLTERYTRVVSGLGLLHAAPGMLIGRKEIAAFMGLGQSSITRLAKYGFPAWRMGRRNYSHVLDILAWMRKQNERHTKRGGGHGSK